MKKKMTLALVSSILTLTLSAFPHHAAASSTPPPPPPPPPHPFRIYIMDASVTPPPPANLGVSVIASILV